MTVHEVRRLEKRLNNCYAITPTRNCWIPKQKPTRKGYVRICFSINKNPIQKYLHILMYEREFGKIPEGLQIHHKCGVKSCCNPAHMELVTPFNHNMITWENRKKGVENG